MAVLLAVALAAGCTGLAPDQMLECEGGACCEGASCADGGLGDGRAAGDARGPNDEAGQQADADVDAETGPFEAGPNDEDGDGVANGADNCPATANVDQADLDGDGEGDACDTDDDADGVPDAEDPCPQGATEGVDTDGDGCRDSEDADDDGDGVPDAQDHCPGTQAGASDLDGDGCADAVDACPSGGYKGADTDGDGCLDIEDAVVGDATLPGVPRIVHVDAAASPHGADGTSWDTAFPLLQDGIASANASLGDAPGAEVWIARGFYYPDEATSGITDGDRTASFQPATGVRLVGGFEPVDGTWVRTEDAMENTILSGDIDQDDGDEIVGDNACHVVGGSVGDPPTDYAAALEMEGLVVERGLANDPNLCVGGGGVGSAGPVTLVRCVVRDNVGLQGGGIVASDVVLVQSRVERNRGRIPAFSANQNARVYGTSLAFNEALAPGGNLFDVFSFSTVVVLGNGSFVNTVFESNFSNPHSEDAPDNFEIPVIAYTQSNSQFDFVQSTFVNNRASEDRTAYSWHCPTGSELRMSGVLALENDGWAAPDANACLTHEASIVRGYSYEGLVPDSTVALGSYFVRLESGFDGPPSDLHLLRSESNPAIDSGPAELPDCPSGTGLAFSWERMHLPDGTPICVDGKLQVDAEGRPRLSGEAVDIGAYELPQ